MVNITLPNSILDTREYRANDILHDILPFYIVIRCDSAMQGDIEMTKLVIRKKEAQPCMFIFRANGSCYTELLPGTAPGNLDVDHISITGPYDADILRKAAYYANLMACVEKLRSNFKELWCDIEVICK